MTDDHDGAEGAKQRQRWSRLGRVAALLVVAAGSAAAYLGHRETTLPARLLAQARTWHYQLQAKQADIARLAGSRAPLLVIDYAATDASGALQPLTRQQVDDLKRGPDGRRLVVAYLSIGEAEAYRPYWRNTWDAQPPSWIIAENCRWPRNYLVEFWQPGWRELVFDGGRSYLSRIIEAGFDGVYLDRIDVHGDIATRFPEARTRMISFVKDLAAEARARKRGFLVIAQNAEELLEDSGYRNAIDAVAKEDLLYGVYGTGKRNPAAMVEGSLASLAKLSADGKPVFAVEYLDSASEIEAARAELHAHGIRANFAPRSLDGSDPTAAPPRNSEAIAEEKGTPEFAQKKCDGVFARENAPGADAEVPAAPPE